MSLSRSTWGVLFAAGLAAASQVAMNAPPIGSGVRFQARQLGPGWHRGFFNQTRTVPPCYLIVTFGPRSSPDQPRRVERIIPIARVQQLQVTSAPGTSLPEWDGFTLIEVPEDSWRPVDLVPLLPAEGQCPFDEP